MTHSLGWGFAGLAAVLVILALVQYSRVRGRLLRLDFGGLPSRDVRSLVRAVGVGRLPDDRPLAAVGVDYARQVVNNYPLRISYAPYSLGAVFAAAVSLSDFAGLSPVVLGLTMVILAGINLWNAHRAHQGAQSVLDALGE